VNLTWLLVAIVYAVAIALTRRARVDLPWRVAAVFYLLVLAFLFRPMTGRYVNFPTDVGQLIYPWMADAPQGLSKFNVSRYEMQDVVFQMAPWAHQVRESWKSLEPPLWNGLVGTGQPLLANMSSAGLSPFRILALPLPLGYSLTAEGAMKILVALTFTFLYLRRRYDELPSAIGAIAFAFSTFMIAWLHMPQASVAAFLPAVLYGIDLIAERRTFGRLVFAAFLGPMIMFTAHPETTAHVVFFATIYALWVAFGEATKEKLRFAGALALACVIAAFLSAPLLLPFIEAMHGSVRYHDLKLRPHSEGTAYSDFENLVPLFQPHYGSRAEVISGFAGYLGVAAWFGLVAWVIANRAWRSREMFFVIGSVLVFATIDDWPIAAPFRHLFALSLNARMRLFVCLLTAAMTAALVHHCKREKLPLIAALLGGAGLLAYLHARTDVAIITSLVVLAIAATRIRLAIAAAVFAELWLAMHDWNPVRPLRELYPKTPLIEALLKVRGSQPYRMAGLDGAFFPNTQAVFGLEDARIHDPMATVRYARVLQAGMPSYDPLEYYPKFKEADAPILDTLNVKWLVTDPGVNLDSSRWKPLYDGKDGRIYENLHVQPRFVAEGAKVEIVRAENDEYELRVDAPHETLVRASIAYWPGWVVRHDGKSLKPGMVGGAFLGFVIPPGRGTVEIEYVPMPFWAGVAAAVLMCVVLSIIRRRVVRD
jgi:Bacterial membrane protein YfhO